MATLLKIKCSCGYNGFVEQTEMDERELNYGGEPPDTFCPECNSDEWQYLGQITCGRMIKAETVA